MLRIVRLFISSPVDVAFERQRLQRTVERLNGEYAQVVRFETIRWETKFYSAHQGVQEGIAEAKDCDIVVAVFWSRLGSALSHSFGTIPAALAGHEGERYPSGSAYEVLTSIAERRRRDALGEAGRPDVFVFRKTEPPMVQVGNSGEIAEAQQQWENLNGFFTRWFRREDGTILSAYHQFRTADDFETEVEALLRDWVKANVQGAAAIVWPIARLGSPFRGLAAFDAQHAKVYFGRDRKVGRAIELLKDAGEAAADAPPAEPGTRDRRARPFLLVVGPSGSGKSSLMRAGIAPRLTAPGVVGSVDVWRTAVMRPGDGGTPFAALATALRADAASDEGGFGIALPEVARTLAEGLSLERALAANDAAASAAVLKALDLIAADHARAEGTAKTQRANLLLLVDQLEDIFRSDVSAEVRTRFAELLGALSATLRVWIVATLRGDLYERLISERAWIALKDAGATYDLAPPGPEELEEIVRLSAAAAGLTYEADAQSGRRLDQVLLGDATSPDILPLLQFTLNRLFEKRETRDDRTVLTLSAYDAMGGIDGAIDGAAEVALAGVGAQERAALPRLLRMLAVPVDGPARSAPTGGRASLAARAVPLHEVRSEPATARLVDALVASRVLLTTRGEGAEGALLRVTHQRVLESWARARKIIADQLEFYRVRADVEQQYARWTAGSRRNGLLVPGGVALAEAERISRRYKDDLPEPLIAFVARSGRRARWRVRALGVATLVFASVAGVAIFFWDAAQKSQRTEAAARTEAVDSYTAAKSTIQQLIASLTGRLAKTPDVTVETIETAFNEIRAAVDKLGEQAAKADPGYDATRANLDLAFAQTYKKVDSGRATQMVESALKLISPLAAAGDGADEYTVLAAEAYALLSDLKRSSDLAAAKAAALAALDGRRRLYGMAKDALPRGDRASANDLQRHAIGLSQILVRLGDIEQQAKRFREAQPYYEEALDIGLTTHARHTDATFRKDTPEAASARELTWTLNKIGSERLRGSAERISEALGLFRSELCFRRRLLEGDDSTELRADVSWSLTRVADASARLRDYPGAATALLEALAIRDILQTRDPKNVVWLRDRYTALARYGQLQLAAGNPDLALAYLTLAERDMVAIKAQNAVESWLPNIAPDLTSARSAVGSERAIAIESSASAIRMQAEEARLVSLRVRPLRSSECWAETQDFLQKFVNKRAGVRAERD